MKPIYNFIFSSAISTACSFAALLTLPASANAETISIPLFTPSPGTSVTISHDYENRLNARRNLHERQSWLSHNIWVHQLVHIAPEKRKTQEDEWLYWSMLDRNKDKNAGDFNYSDGETKGLMARYYFQQDELKIVEANSSQALVLSENQLQRVTAVANNESWFHTIINLASLKPYAKGQPVELSKALSQKFFKADKANIAWVDTQTRWQHEIAEFRFEFNYGKPSTRCQGHFWVMAKLGRPVLLNLECKFANDVDDYRAQLFDYLSRAYSYSDLQLSNLSPQPLPASQPRGKILDALYSSHQQQLVLLNKDISSGLSWLTFWDTNERKPLFTARTPGDTLLKNSDGSALFSLSRDTRMLSGYAEINRRFVNFGSIVGGLDSSRAIVSADTIGRYPVLLNANNELEIWNPGYGTISFAQKFTHSHPAIIATADDRRLLTINTKGDVFLNSLQIDASGCNTDSNINDSYCDKPTVRFKESNTPLYRLPSQNAEKTDDIKLKRIQLHPSKPMVLYQLKNGGSGVFNYQAKTHNQLVSSGAIDFWGDDMLVTDYGLHSLDGTLVTPHKEQRYAFSKFIVAAQEKGVVFKPHRGTSFQNEEINIIEAERGDVIHNIQNETLPIDNLSSIGGGVIAVLSSELLSNRTQTQLVDIKNLAVDRQTIDGKMLSMQRDGKYWLVHTENALLIFVENQMDEPSVIAERVIDPQFAGDELFYARDKTIFTYDIANKTSRELHKFESQVHEFSVLSEDGQKIVARLDHGNFALPHINKVLELPFSLVSKNALIANKKTGEFFVSGLSGFSKSFNVAIPSTHKFDSQGKATGEFQPHWSAPSTLLLVNNQELWQGTKDGDLFIYGSGSGLLRERIQAHKGEITALIQLDTQTVASAGMDGLVKIWRTDIRNGKYKHGQHGIVYEAFIKSDIGRRQPKLLATIVMTKGDEMVASTSDGYYWATPKALHHTSLINLDTVTDYKRVDFWLNRPDIVLERLGEKANPSTQSWRDLVDFRQRRSNKPAIIPSEILDSLNETVPKILNAQDKMTIRDNESLQVSLPDYVDKNSTLHVSVNDVPLFGLSGKPIEKLPALFDIPLLDGLNRIRAFTVNKNLASSSQVLSYNAISNTKKKPRLFLLAVGVSDYEYDPLDLNYASKDAQDIALALSKSEQYEKTNIKLIVDGSATKEAIQEAKSFLAQSSPQDHVIVFMAGHGFLDSRQQYFFGTADVHPKNPEQRGLAYSSIVKLLDGIPAIQKLLLLDTCHSGESNSNIDKPQLAQGVRSRGLTLKSKNVPTNTLVIAHEKLQKSFVDLRESTGSLIISAAGAQEFAYERDEVKNGLFTATLLGAMKDKKADTNNDGEISISELRTYSYEQVVKMTGGAQKPTTRKDNLSIDFAIF